MSNDPASGQSDRRRPQSVYGVGQEPDPRFSLANQRTALAWARTSLAMVAGGAALGSLSHVAGTPWWAPVAGAALSLLGGVLIVVALFGWRRNERALRLSLPLPAPAGLPILVVAVAVFAVVVASLAMWDAL